ncbi:MAG: amidohydrolase family protein [Anaerolineae bacterium]|nr:amidohydrolase family protein [Anaerolineae bacterium]
MNKIDAHMHYTGDSPDFLALLEDLNLKMLNVCVVGAVSDRLQDQVHAYQKLAKQFPERYAWCTSFPLPAQEDYATPGDYAARAIAGLEADFNAGAVACKFWKNIGMDARKPDGSFLMIHDPIFTPIYDYLAKVEKPALMHIAEPLACWQPLHDPQNPHYGYYSQNPEWHMYGKPEYPSHQALMDARDHVLAHHSKLHLVGAHLGSLEYDVAEVAKRLEKYPNFAVDTSARLADLTIQNTATVRQFFLDYQDRILFGTDMIQWEPLSTLPDKAREQRIAEFAASYQTSFAYYETDQMLTIRGREVQGLGLPEKVLEKIYWTNAHTWYPGV